jgi:hypothetical protein
VNYASEPRVLVPFYAIKRLSFFSQSISCGLGIIFWAAMLSNFNEPAVRSGKTRFLNLIFFLCNYTGIYSGLRLMNVKAVEFKIRPHSSISL